LSSSGGFSEAPSLTGAGPRPSFALMNPKMPQINNPSIALLWTFFDGRPSLLNLQTQSLWWIDFRKT
jgi:hypothetical protein